MAESNLTAQDELLIEMILADDSSLTREDAIAQIKAAEKTGATIAQNIQNKNEVQMRQAAQAQYIAMQANKIAYDQYQNYGNADEMFFMTQAGDPKTCKTVVSDKYASLKRDKVKVDSEVERLTQLTSSDKTSEAMAYNELIKKFEAGQIPDKITAYKEISDLSQRYGSLSDSSLASMMKFSDELLDAEEADDDELKNGILYGQKRAVSGLLDDQDKYLKDLEKAKKQQAQISSDMEEAMNSGLVTSSGSVYDNPSGPPYMKKITEESSTEDKNTVADLSNEQKEGYIGAGNGTFLKYLKNPELYTNPSGQAFINSDNAYKMLEKMTPQEQHDSVKAAQNILGDSNKCYELDSTNPQLKNPNDKVLTLTKGDQKVKYGLVTDNITDDFEKAQVKKWEENDLVKEQANKVEEKTNTPDVKPPEEAPKEEIVPDDYNKSQFMKIANHDDVPYERVNGYNKIRFPKTWSGKYTIDIMGLPPTRIQRTPVTPLISSNAFELVTPGFDELLPEMYVYDEDEQLKKSFLKLTINPIDVEFVNGMNGEKPKKQADKETKLSTNRSAVLTNIEYNFAIQMNSQLTYNHQNSYAASGFENTFGGMFQGISDAVSQFSGLSQVTGGIDGIFKDFGGLANRAGSAFKQSLSELQTSLANGAAETFKDNPALYNDAKRFTETMSNLANVGLERLSGGRIDLPDIWNGSQTNIQHSFTIELRTMNPDPLSDQYFKDIILPLYVLMTLSLPTDTSGIVYKTPPYISCNVDQVFEIKLGAITNISIDPHLDELNMKRAPRHITVQLSIRDLYSVMKQKAYDNKNNDTPIGKENLDTTDKDTFINNFVKYAEKGQGTPTTNEPYYLTEFAKIPAYLSALEDYKKDYQNKVAEKLNKASVNAQIGSKLGLKGLSADISKVAQSIKAGVDKVVQVKNGNFITSIGNAITSVTKGIKNIIAGTQKAIPQVRNLINTGKMVMTSVNGLKSAVKLVGQTANLDGILNGQFASSVGFAFSNIANATDVVEKISNGCLSGGGSKSVVNAVGQIPQEILTNNISNRVTDTGSINLSDQIRNSACSMYALANMFGSTYANVVGLKNLGSSSGDIFDKAQSLFENLGGIANGVDSFMIGQSVGSTPSGIVVDPVMQKYVTAMTRGMIDKGITTANNVSSNTKLQKEINDVSQIGTRIITDPEEVKEITAVFESANEKAFQAEVNAIKKMNGVSDQVAKGMATAKMFINQDL